MKELGYQLIFIYLFIFILSWIPPQSVEAQERGTLVIEGGTLIDGNGSRPLRDVTILIRGNRIETISTEKVQYPSDAQVLDAGGKFILPGFMNAHVHYSGSYPELFLNHGVTSVFSIGSGGHWALAQRKAINEGKILGPRVFLAVGSLAGGRISDLSSTSGASGDLSGRQVAPDADTARRIASRFINAGADMIKVHRGPPIEAYEAAIEETHRAGLPVVAQPLGPTVYAREAILAGADILEHSAGVGYSVSADPSKWKGWGHIEVHSVDPTAFSNMDEAKARDLIKLMVERDVYLEPDFIAVGRGFHANRDKFVLQDIRLLDDVGLAYAADRIDGYLRRYHEFDELPRAEWELRNQGYHNRLRFHRMFVEAGGKLLTGTDTGGWAVPGLGLHHEMEILADEVGITPMQVIMAATRYNAEAFRIVDRLGTVEEGKLADIVILNADPLQDIANTLEIAWVIKDGEVVDRTYHPGFRNPMPRGAVEGVSWVRALKRVAFRATSFGQPIPGIESISPVMVTQGGPTLTLTVQGVNFTDRSLAYFNGEPIPTRLVSGTELEVTVDADLLLRVGTYPITVRNPGRVQRPEWGDGTSNKAHLIVDFRY